MYFKSRLEAGQQLALRLVPKYQGQNSIVVALSSGGVVIGLEIVRRLNCGLAILLSEAITLPRETDSVGSVTQDGNLVYNTVFSAGELEDMTSEYRTLIDQERIEKLHKMNRLVGSAGLVQKSDLTGRNVMIVSDGLMSGFSLDVAAEFLKPVRLNKLIIATPVASVQAVDRMHILGDDIYCLGVLDNYIGTDHYYDDEGAPDAETALKMIRQSGVIAA